jgi:hypothetical protein
MDVSSRSQGFMLKLRRQPAWLLLCTVALTLTAITSCLGASATPLRIGAYLWTGDETLTMKWTEPASRLTR